MDPAARDASGGALHGGRRNGWVRRLGIGDDGLITHQLVPSDARPGWFGSHVSLIMLTSNVTAEFESLPGTRVRWRSKPRADASAISSSRSVSRIRTLTPVRAGLRPRHDASFRNRMAAHRLFGSCLRLFAVSSFWRSRRRRERGRTIHSPHARADRSVDSREDQGLGSDRVARWRDAYRERLVRGAAGPPRSAPVRGRRDGRRVPRLRTSPCRRPNGSFSAKLTLTAANQSLRRGRTTRRSTAPPPPTATCGVAAPFVPAAGRSRSRSCAGSRFSFAAPARRRPRRRAGRPSPSSRQPRAVVVPRELRAAISRIA